jgi:ribonuclease HI
MAKSGKYYTVWKGRRTGVFRSWKECEAQVCGFTGAEYMAFPTIEQAKTAQSMRYADVLKGRLPLGPFRRPAKRGPTHDSICVDASCIGNPGPMEYRGVHLGDGRLIFHVGPVHNGTNNVGEFLAIVHALEYLKARGKDWPVYSDSQNAISWVRGKACRTTLSRNARSAKIFALIDKAEAWLCRNQYNNRILKWKTEEWGEIPADFARK